MKFQNLLLSLGTLALLLVATLISWYEGSQLIDRPWTWKYTAVFSNRLHGKVTASSDILAIDYFIYAAKYEPLFPFLMAVSLLSLVLQAAHWLAEKDKLMLPVSLLVIGLASIGFSVLLGSSPTKGLNFFTTFFGLIGFLSVFGTIVFKNTVQDQT